MENGGKPHDVMKVLQTFGRYHWYHWFLVSLPAVVHTMVNLNFVIVAGNMDYRCRVPECDSSDATHNFPAWWPTWQNSTTNDKCTRPVLADTFIQNDTCFSTSFTQEVVRCTEWIYENNNTIVSELNLACDPWKINMVGVIHNIGLLLSLLTFGWISDRFGRKPSMIVSATGCAIGLIKLFSVNYTMFVVVDFFEAYICGGMYLATSVMLIEFSNKSTRVYAGVLVANVVCFGEIFLGVFAMFFPYWKHLILIIYAPPLIFFSYIFLVRESPRWQVLNGKIDEAKETIAKIAKINKIPINNQELNGISEETLKSIFNIKDYTEKDGFKEIVMSKEIMMRLIVGAVCRFTSAFVYYGIIINAVLLPGDKNTNFFLSTLMTLPGELIAMYLMNKIGRKIPLIVSYLLSGIMCASAGYISSTGGRIAAFLIGKMLIATCFTSVGTYCMELYPTSTRGTLLGIGFLTSRVGALLAPLTPLLIPISPNLPPILFGVSAVLSSILLTQTPETKNLPLFETIQQVENYTRAAREIKRCATEVKSSTETIYKITCSNDTIVTRM